MDLAEAAFFAAVAVGRAEDVERLDVLAARVRDWDAVIAVAERTGLGTVLHLAMGERHSAAPLGLVLRRRLADHALRNVASNLLLIEVAARTQAILKSVGVSGAWIKGAALLALVPEARTARELSDLDLLVPVQDVAAADAALRGAGWARVQFARGYGDAALDTTSLEHLAGNHAVSLRSVEGVVVELHHALPATSLPHHAAAAVLERAVEVDVGRRVLRVAAASDSLLIAAHHGLGHHADDPSFLPRLLWDVARLDACPGIVEGLAADHVVARARGMCAAANEVLQGDRPPLGPGSGDLIQLLAGPLTKETERLQWLGWTFRRLRKGRAVIAKGGWRALFPPRAFMAERYGPLARGPWLPGLHLRRLVEAAWRVLFHR